METWALKNLRTLVTTSAKETGKGPERNILGDQISHQISTKDMEIKSLLSLRDALAPLDPQEGVTMVAMELLLEAPLEAPQKGAGEARLLILLFTVLLTAHLEEVEGVAEALQTDLRVVVLIPLVVVVDAPEEEGALLVALLMALLMALRVVVITPLVVGIDAPEEKVVLLVGVAENRRGILAPLCMRTLIPDYSPP